jgi:hypothetical protein
MPVAETTPSVVTLDPRSDETPPADEAAKPAA